MPWIYTYPVSPARRLVLYSLLRIGLFAVAFAGLLAVQVNPFLAAALAAVIGLCVTYIFFRSQRDEVIRSFAEWRASDRDQPDDEDAEDDAMTDGAASVTSDDDGRSSGVEDPGRSEGQNDGEGDAVQQGGETRELEREHELGGGTSGQRDDHGGQRRQ